MRIADWTKVAGPIAAAVATLGLPAGAAAAPARADAQVRAVVTSYLGAVRHGDATRVCRLVAGAHKDCAAVVARDLGRLHGAPEVESVATAGVSGRAVIAFATEEDISDGAVFRRTRLVLHRRDGRWWIVATGTLPGPGAFLASPPDPAPRGGGTRARLARLVDDEQLGLSGDPGLACAVLAHRPARLTVFACDTLVADHAIVGPRAAARWARLRSFTLSGGGTHARIVASVTVGAVVHPRRMTFTRRLRTRTETLFAQRSGRDGAWRLVKPPASFYAALGIPAPTDVAAPAPGATWPQPDAALPSLSGTPVPAACAVPRLLWPGRRTCVPAVQLVGATLPDGRGVVAWSDGRVIRARAVSGGSATAPAAALPVSRGRQDTWDTTLAPAGGGVLALESGFDARGWSAGVTPLDGTSAAPTGPAQATDGPRDDIVEVTPVAQAPGSAGAALAIGAGTRIERLTATGTRAVPDVRVASVYDRTRLALLPDGTYLQVSSADAYPDGDHLVLRRLGADGHALGAALAIAPAGSGFEVSSDTPALAVDAAGQVLVLWREDDGHGQQVVRAWTGVPGRPAAETVTITSSTYSPMRDADLPAAELGDLGGEGLGLAAAALPGDHGWAVAIGRPDGGLVAGRLTPAGAAAAPLGAITTTFGTDDDGTPAFALAGDTVAWIAPPRIAGLPQVRSAPLP